MTESERFRSRFVLGVFMFVLIMAAIGWFIKKSILFAAIGIGGWLVFVGLLLKYLSRHRGDQT